MSRTAAAILALVCATAPMAVAAQTAPVPAAAAARPPAPRQTIANVAQAIEEHFFDAGRGKAIADTLRAAAARGEFDRFVEPRELAVELTNRLQPYDRHFAVTWAADAPEPPPPGQGGPAGEPGQGPSADERLAMRRANYGVEAVDVLPGNIGYIALGGFADIDFDDPADPTRRAIDAALTLTSGTDAVIIDVRDNGGGSPAMVGYLVSAFTPKDADIYNVFHFRGGQESEAPRVRHPNPNLAAPVYILTSGRTGSAAESFAYTMKAAGRATVVGEASAGAANPGGQGPIGGGFMIFISAGSPRNPVTGGNWEGDGVAPDVPVPSDQALTRAQALALQHAAPGLAGVYRVENRWALEALSPPVLSIDLAPYAGDYNGVRIEQGPEGLRYLRERRPAWSLYPIGADIFAIRGDPTRRVRFVREDGRIVALEVLAPDGPGGLYRRAG
ncbi:MAG: S41 family peptidase [Caulobacteraceae bacterium]|nr:S41 family peptidase [Caulobacteraceae bacterium]